jgi:hypothetical protein
MLLEEGLAKSSTRRASPLAKSSTRRSSPLAMGSNRAESEFLLKCRIRPGNVCSFTASLHDWFFIRKQLLTFGNIFASSMDARTWMDL